MIERATHRDVATIASLAIKMWSNHTIDELTKEFEDILTSNESAIFIYFRDEQAIGFAQCQLRHDYVEGIDSSPVGYLEGIYVEPEYRHRGYAKQLLAKCEEWAKGKGCFEFASDCELENSNSLAFHLDMGFSEVNRIICFTKLL